MERSIGLSLKSDKRLSWMQTSPSSLLDANQEDADELFYLFLRSITRYGGGHGNACSSELLMNSPSIPWYSVWMIRGARTLLLQLRPAPLSPSIGRSDAGYIYLTIRPTINIEWSDGRGAYSKRPTDQRRTAKEKTACSYTTSSKYPSWTT